MSRLIWILPLALAACAPQPPPDSGFGTGPAWQERLQTAGVDKRPKHWPLPAELTLDEAARVLEVCTYEPTRDCAEPLLAAQPQLRGAALGFAWTSALRRARPELVALLLARGALADDAAVAAALERRDAERDAILAQLRAAGATIPPPVAVERVVTADRAPEPPRATLAAAARAGDIAAIDRALTAGPVGDDELRAAFADAVDEASAVRIAGARDGAPRTALLRDVLVEAISREDRIAARRALALGAPLDEAFAAWAAPAVSDNFDAPTQLALATWRAADIAPEDIVRELARIDAPWNPERPDSALRLRMAPAAADMDLAEVHLVLDSQRLHGVQRVAQPACSAHPVYGGATIALAPGASRIEQRVVLREAAPDDEAEVMHWTDAAPRTLPWRALETSESVLVVPEDPVLEPGDGDTQWLVAERHWRTASDDTLEIEYAIDERCD